VSIRDPRPDPGPDQPPVARRWRVSPALPALKLAGAALIAVLGVALNDERPARWLAAAVAAALTAWALRDLIAPVRVAADTDGVTVVAGFAARRRLSWDQIEAVRVDTRPRLGVRTETLEIDTGETLFVFGAYDLGAPPSDVAAVLETLRSARSP
jgi:Bacterial PH domain